MYRHTEHPCHSVYAEVREKLVGVDSFLLLRGSWKLTSEDQACSKHSDLLSHLAGLLLTDLVNLV